MWPKKGQHAGYIASVRWHIAISGEGSRDIALHISGRRLMWRGRQTNGQQYLSTCWTRNADNGYSSLS
jgi:hypothetical protein